MVRDSRVLATTVAVCLAHTDRHADGQHRQRFMCLRTELTFVPSSRLALCSIVYRLSRSLPLRPPSFSPTPPPLPLHLPVMLHSSALPCSNRTCLHATSFPWLTRNTGGPRYRFHPFTFSLLPKVPIWKPGGKHLNRRRFKGWTSDFTGDVHGQY